MSFRFRTVHWFALTAIALLTALFHGVAGFPFQVALGLALLTWATVDVIHPKRYRR